MPRAERGRGWLGPVTAVVALLLGAALALPLRVAAQQDALPLLTGPVTDTADVIDGPSERELDRLSRALQAATGDAIVVVTTQTVAPYGDIRDYANELFENQGQGIGARGKDNGLLIVLAVEDRRVWVEVGYGLEGIITDGFAGETSRQVMTPRFREGDYGAGLLAGARRLAARIAEARGVSLDTLPLPRRTSRGPVRSNLTWLIPLLVILLLVASSNSGGRRRRRVYWAGGPWSGWGGGGFGGTFGGGGGFSGGGFGGFGGGSSGGGGGGASW